MQIEIKTSEPYKAFYDGTHTNRFQWDGIILLAWDPIAEDWTAIHRLSHNDIKAILAEARPIDLED